MENREIVAYSIVGGTNSAQLITNIENAMTLGWQPFGSPYLVGQEVCQSMVKYETVIDIEESV